MKTLKELIETMSNEEKELHKDLIAECIQRDADITQASTETKENIKKIGSIFVEMVSNVNKINKESQKIRESVLENTLQNLPDDKFFS